MPFGADMNDSRLRGCLLEGAARQLAVEGFEGVGAERSARTASSAGKGKPCRE